MGWNKVDVRVYQAVKMTGRSAKGVVEQTTRARRLFQKYGIEVLDPVQEENVEPVAGMIIGSVKDKHDNLKKFWKRDKEMIRQAHVLVDLTPTAKSEGVLHEIGYARYHLWKPVVRIYDGEPLCGIQSFEDDALVNGVEAAAALIRQRWGTKKKRLMWRARLMWKKLPRFIKHQLSEWK